MKIRIFLEKTTVEREKIFFPPEQFSAVLHRGDECWKCVKQPCLAAETVFEFLFPDELGCSCEFFALHELRFITCQAGWVNVGSAVVVLTDGC